MKITSLDYRRHGTSLSQIEQKQIDGVEMQLLASLFLAVLWFLLARLYGCSTLYVLMMGELLLGIQFWQMRFCHRQPFRRLFWTGVWMFGMLICFWVILYRCCWAETYTLFGHGKGLVWIKGIDRDKIWSFGIIISFVWLIKNKIAMVSLRKHYNKGQENNWCVFAQ